jgi:hypothetical protein
VSGFRAFRIGALPVDLINDILGTELEHGDLFCSKAAHEHIAIDHAEDYDLIKANLIECVTNPTYVGQEPKHARNFNLVKRVEGLAVLIAIGLERHEEHGTYNLRSAYCIKAETIELRRQKGYLQSTIGKKKGPQ